MEDKQRVYIKGDRNRGDEVIKLLENLGGRNCHNCKGDAEKNIYYINPLGDINCVMECQYSEWLLVKEFYEEIKLPRWKPKYDENYYQINGFGEVVGDIWYNTQIDESFYKFGNCFRTKEEAEAARDKIKEILNKHK